MRRSGRHQRPKYNYLNGRYAGHLTSGANERDGGRTYARLQSGRRASILLETGLLEIQANHLKEFRQVRQALPASRKVIHPLLEQVDSISLNGNPASRDVTNTSQAAFCVLPICPTSRCKLGADKLLWETLERWKRSNRQLKTVSGILFDRKYETDELIFEE